jgi:acyl-[acyl carrier protein]--UDP-N-acetylglucosamine O-acyltransferase
LIHETAYIHPTAVIYPNVIIEANVYIGAYCIIGAPAEWKGREQENGGVLIMEGARLTGLVTVDSGTDKRTIIGKNAYLMKGVHCGHDSIICEGVTLSCGAKVGGHTIVRKNTNVGLNAVLHQKLDIPEGCMIGASSFVGKKSILKPFHKYAGVPVRELGKNGS